jgi:hypothetical protein
MEMMTLPDGNSFPKSLRRASWKRLNELMSPAAGYSHLASVCTCAKINGHPGPHHAADCPCYATSRVAIMQCTGVREEREPTSRGHFRKIISGPIKFVIDDLTNPKEPV